MLKVSRRFNLFHQWIHSYIPYKVAHSDTTLVFFSIWASFLLAYIVNIIFFYTFDNIFETLLLVIVWLILLPADFFLPGPTTPISLRIAFLFGETFLMMSLGIFDKFTITGYMLFALVGQAAFVLPIYASLGYTLFLGVCFYLALALPYLVENKPYLFEISWLIGAIFTWAAMTLMRKARDQHAEIAELNAKLAETHSLVQAQAEKLAQQAIEDSLTGLNNRRYLDADLPREFERARRLERKLTLAMLDIDHFKHINDRFSHHTGDQVLVTLANIFRQNCRTAVDSIVRYGGEEFIIYFPETDLHTAANIICERIRQATENYNWDWISHGLNVTLSIGLAEADKVSNHIDLIKTADSKLYEAKNGGRNRICSV